LIGKKDAFGGKEVMVVLPLYEVVFKEVWDLQKEVV
jgi:hypothetical protein